VTDLTQISTTELVRLKNDEVITWEEFFDAVNRRS
jgi:hypothetical protein